MHKKLFCIENRFARGRMNKDEDGQGLVEYALILVLVAIVVIAILPLLGPQLGETYGTCTQSRSVSPFGFSYGLDEAQPYCSYGTNPLELNYFSDGLNHLYDPTSLRIASGLRSCRFSDCGTLEVQRDEMGQANGIIVYTSGPVFNGFINFDFELCRYPPHSDRCEIGRQIINSRSADERPSENFGVETVLRDVSVDALTTITANESGDAEIDWDVIFEQSGDFLRQARQIENSTLEASFVTKEAFTEAIAIIVEYANDTNNSVLQAGIEAVVQAVDDRNGEAVVPALAGIATELALVPENVRLAVIEEITPRIIETYHTLHGVVVADDAIDMPLQLLVDEEEKNPGSTYGSIPHLLERWDKIQQFNQGIEVIQPLLKEGIFFVIGIFADSGDEDYIELARQYENDFFWGLLNEAIDKALVEPEGIRTSLESKAKTAWSAYLSGDLEGAGTALSDILNEVRAQNSKHITPDSATLIQESVIELAEGLEIPLTPGD